jgi:hypothetical protein
MINANLSAFSVGKAVGRGGGPKSWQYTGTSFSVSSHYVVGRSTDTIYQYTSGGSYTGVSTNVGALDANPTGLAHVNGSTWMVGYSTDSAYKTGTAESFSIASQDGSPSGITWDGSHFWVSGNQTRKIYKYTSAGVYTGTSITHTLTTGLFDVAWDGTYLWAVGAESGTQKVYQYQTDGTYTGLNFDVSGQEGSPRGLAYIDGSLWVIGFSTDSAYKYSLLPTP